MRKNVQLSILFIITVLFSTVSFAKTCDEYYSGKSLERKASRFKNEINHAAKKHGVSRDFIKAVIAVESCFRPNVRGSLGEKGLMQLMPATARKMGVKNGYNSWQNVDGGTRYLKYLLRRFNGNKRYAAAAYNGGPGAVSQTKGPRFPQVKRYSRHVMRAYHKMNATSDVVSQSSKKVRHGKKALPHMVKVATSRVVNRKMSYRVREGQTLYSISRVTGITVKQLQALNHLSSNRLKVGQVLRLSAKSNLSKNKPVQKKLYRVEKNQTLYSIARKTGVSVQQIKKLNKLRSSSIKVGQTLRLK